MKTLGCIQSSYVPWRGYFDIIRQSDVFVFHDDIQYTKQDWRNRNRIKTVSGAKWLTVPVQKGSTRGTIDQVLIDNTRKWGKDHWNAIKASYEKAPYFHEYASFFEDALARRWERLSELNIHLINGICDFLAISTELIRSSALGITGRKTDRLIQMCEKLQVDVYLSGPSAQSYIEEEKFRRIGAAVRYMAYNYPEYSQLHGAFRPDLSIVDLLFNCGPASRDFISNRRL